jgi:hypothetical protein
MIQSQPVRIIKTKWFERFARRKGLAAAQLVEAIERAEAG